MDTESIVAITERLQRVGEQLLETVDYERYDRWNESGLRILDLVFGQSSEPFMRFRFPGGGEAANSRESRVKSSITQKLKVLAFVKEDLQDQSLKPKLGWTSSQEEIDQELVRLETA